MSIKTFINGQENGVITYVGDTEPCAVYVNGERQDNISYIPDVAEGVDTVSYKSEYKNNLRTLQIEGNTEQEGGLPSEYQEVEYIESTGTQYIDTGFKPNQDTRVVADFQSLDTTLNFLFGARESYSSKAYTTSYYHNEFGVSYGDSANVYIAPIDTNRHTVDFNKNVVSLGTITYAFPTKTFSCPSNLCLFVCNQNGTNTGYGLSRIFSLKVYDNGTLVRDYIPCYRKSDNVIGLYDLVNSVFYTNAGSGTFLKGKDAPTLPDEYQQVEYIESTGSQYIDTGLAPYLGLNTEINVVPIDAGYLFGSTNGQSIDYYGFMFNKGMWYQCYLGTGSYPSVGSWSNNTEYKIEIIGKQFYSNNVLLYDFASKGNDYSFKTTKPIFLFGLNYGNTYNGSKMRIKSCKFYDDNGVVRDYVPCYRKSDNVIGLYDLANDVFYTNAGTGTFSKGADVTTTVYPTTVYPTIATPQLISNCGDSQVDITVRGKNLFDISKIKPTGVSYGIHISSVGENSITITSTEDIPDNSNGYCGSRFKLKDACPNIEVGKTYILTLNNSGRANKSIYLASHGGTWYNNTTKTITETMLDDTVVFYGFNRKAYPNEELPVSVDIFDIMITEVDNTTDYEPYFESTTVSIPANTVLDINSNTWLEFGGLGKYKDTIVIGRTKNEVKYTQRICRVRPFADEGGTLSYGGQLVNNDIYTHDIWIFTLNRKANASERNLVKCEFAKVLDISDVSNLDTNTFGAILVTENTFYLYFPISLGITSVNDLNSYLAQNGGYWGLSIEYVLESPVEWNVSTIDKTLSDNLLSWARNTKNQTNIIEITSDLSVSKTSVNYAKWGGKSNV